MRKENASQENWKIDCLKLLSKNKGVYIFNYDVALDRLTYCGSGSGLNFPQKDMQVYNLLKNDSCWPRELFPKYKAYIDMILQKECQGTTENRICLTGKVFHWYRISYHSILNEEGKVYRIVGYAVDVQKDKDRETDSYLRETAFRKAILSGAFLSLKFDLAEKRRIMTEEDILPAGIPNDVDIDSLFKFLGQWIKPEDAGIIKPFDSRQKLLRLADGKSYKEKFDCRIRSSDGSYSGYRWGGFTVLITKNDRKDHGNLFFFALDIEEKKKRELALINRTRTDILTGFLNMDEFRRIWERKRETRVSDVSPDKKGFLHALLVLNFDSFKELNETEGFECGNQILREEAENIRAMLHEEDGCSRMGGVEFVLSFKNIPDEDTLKKRIRVLNSALVKKTKQGIEITASIGVAVYRDGSPAGFDELYREAGIALNLVRSQGGNGFFVYSDKATEREGPPSYKKKVTIGVAGNKRNNIRIRTFGYFDIFVDESAVYFPRAKAKELLALLVDRKGGFVSGRDAIGFLWENEVCDTTTLSRFRKVAMEMQRTLDQYGIGDIVETVRGSRRINPQKVDCDLYCYLGGDAGQENQFTGSYLSNYSWGEGTLSELEERKTK